MRRLEADFNTAVDGPCSAAAGPIGVAVSGGGDSAALLVLAAEWAARAGRELLALTFDHGLREASASEAEAVGAAAAHLGVSHRTLRWNNGAPRQALARRARHAALAGAVRDAGGDTLLMGHTLGDQRETFLMRARQSSGWYGLAGMRALSISPVWPEGRGVRVVRPLLHAEREDLRAYLAGRGQKWIEDPSNEDARFERVRVRSALSSCPALAPQIDSIMRRLCELRLIEDRRLAHWMRQQVIVTADGRVTASPAGLPPESFRRGLSLLLQLVSGEEHPPRGASLQALVGAQEASGRSRRLTLMGVIVSIGNGEWHLEREPAAVTPGIAGGHIWDRRFVRAGGALCDLETGKAGIAGPQAATLPPPGRWNCLLNQRLQSFIHMLDAKV